ncbi:MAG TPA: hypothetical protein VF518_07325, partial [Polyangia bacterium]
HPALRARARRQTLIEHALAHPHAGRAPRAVYRACAGPGMPDRPSCRLDPKPANPIDSAIAPW